MAETHSDFSDFAEEVEDIVGSLDETVSAGEKDAIDNLITRVAASAASRGISASRIDDWQGDADGPPLASSKGWMNTKTASGHTFSPHPKNRKVVRYLEFDRDPAKLASGDTTMYFIADEGPHEGTLVQVDADEMDERDETYSGWIRSRIRAWKKEDTPSAEIDEELDRLMSDLS